MVPINIRKILSLSFTRAEFVPTIAYILAIVTAYLNYFAIWPSFSIYFTATVSTVCCLC